MPIVVANLLRDYDLRLAKLGGDGVLTAKAGDGKTMRPCHSSHKSIAFAANGQDMLRILGIAFQFLAKPGDVDIHGSGSDEGLLLPNLLQDLFARQDLPTMIDQEAEQLGLLGRESHNLWAATKFVAHKVRRDAAEFDTNDWRELFFVNAAQERIDSGDEFIGIEGFCQIVIRTRA